MKENNRLLNISKGLQTRILFFFAIFLLIFSAVFIILPERTPLIQKILWAVLFMAAGMGLMVLLMRLIFVRLDRISEILKAHVRDEEDAPPKIPVKCTDEIGVMTGWINQILYKSCKMVSLIKDQSVHLSNVGNELSENMGQTAATITEISGNIRNVKSHVENQSASMRATHTSMEHVVKNIDLLNTQVEAQTASVSQSSSAVEKMLANLRSVTNTLIKNAENVQRLTSASDVGRTSLDEVSRDIQGIAEESEGLLEINAVMQNIASQTNLLSMNAAIEAAHAGEVGKGFAVVAGEIRKLAESSSEQSRTISTVLKKIKESIDKITKSTGVVMDKFKAVDTGVHTVSQQEANIRGVMEEQSVGSEQILEAIGRLHDTTFRVRESSAEMLKDSRDVIRGGNNLTTAIGEITDDINKIASGVDHINSAVSRVHTISENAKEHIDIMFTEVNKFKCELFSEYVWDKSIAVGQELIDSQHQQLFAVLNDLLRVCCNEDNAKNIQEDFKKSIDFLAAYVVKHFSEEEELQRSNEYPDYHNHKNIHENFKKTLEKLAAKWLAQGPSKVVYREIRTQIGDWLISHIKIQDARIGAFLRNKENKDNLARN